MTRIVGRLLCSRSAGDALTRPPGVGAAEAMREQAGKPATKHARTLANGRAGALGRSREGGTPQVAALEVGD